MAGTIERKVKKGLKVLYRTVRDTEIKRSNREAFKELEEIKQKVKGFDRKHIWAFNSGNTGKDFRGNPKYLFAYICNYRKDIFAYWICPDEITIALVKKLGFTGVLSGTAEANYLIEKTGVCVSEQAKHYIPFKDVVYLNLWHGMGYKLTERSRTFDGDDLRFDLCAKYIKNNALYLDRMILAVTCPMQEEQFVNDFRISREHMLRIGYARCTYQQKYSKIVTFNHDILARKNLPADTRIAVFAPTFRNKQGNTFLDAMKDLEALHECCRKNHILLVFKMHPIMEKELGYLNAIEAYGDKPYFYFWDNRDDIYEIMDRIDLLIYDYSSIYSDFLIAGVKHYIRYIYDMDEMVEQGNFESVEEYYSRTSGTICADFEELLQAIDHFEDTYNPQEMKEIYDKQWSYAGEDDFEKTVKTVLEFEPTDNEHPVLHSFDIFDTLISRKGLAPESIFYAVKERMQEKGGYPADFVRRYPEHRHAAEISVRIYMDRSKEQRNSNHVEITLAQIFEKMREVCGITEAQAEELMQWEIDQEIADVIPLNEQIDKVKQLLADGETVILISDMYLPKEVIIAMLKKADPILAELPFYLSNEYGVLKTSSELFFEVYRRTKPFYYFGKWIHTGDNQKADQTMPRKLGINTRRIEKLEFSTFEQKFTEKMRDLDSFYIAAMESRMRKEFVMPKADFVIDFVAPIMVSYVDWACRDAMNRGMEMLYFVSRDGHPLKRIADALIEANGWPLKTKYIYASRRLWRIPSYIDEIDGDYWAEYGGNFNDIKSKEKLLKAMDIEDAAVFHKLFPEMDIDHIDFADWTNGQPAKALVPSFKASAVFREYLLERAKQQRELVCGYLKQEIDPDVKSAYVEFYGRGYNQTCHSRLWNLTIGKEEPLYYYYAKSVHPTEGLCHRLNMTLSNLDLFFMESIFANMPYRSVEQYQMVNGRIEPVLKPILYDHELFDAMECILPEYARRYAKLGLKDPMGSDHGQFDFALEYFRDNKDDPFLYENFGKLVDAVSMYADKMQFARPYTMEDIENFKNGIPRGRGTRSITMSYKRSSKEVRNAYDELYQVQAESKIEEGTILSEELMKENREMEQQLRNHKERNARIREYYNHACDKYPAANTILIVVPGDHTNSDIIYSLKKVCADVPGYTTEYLTLASEKELTIAEKCAQAKYILLAGNIPLLSNVEFRQETKCIILNDAGFALYRKGANVKHQLFWRRKLDAYKYNTNAKFVENPAEKQAIHLRRAYVIGPEAVETIHGSCVTDVYFDKKYLSDSRKLLEKEYPDLKGRKIIFWMSAVRKKAENQDWIETLDMERLAELLGPKYAVIFDTQGKKNIIDKCGNAIFISGFCYALKGKISARKAICAADIIVGDYRDTFFEAALLRKPVYSTAEDYEAMMSQNMLYDLAELQPYPFAKNAEHLAKMIQSDSYDYSAMNRFCKDYLEYCDGHSADRIIELIKNND